MARDISINTCTKTGVKRIFGIWWHGCIPRRKNFNSMGLLQFCLMTNEYLHMYIHGALYMVSRLAGCHGARGSPQPFSLDLTCHLCRPDISEWGESGDVLIVSSVCTCPHSVGLCPYSMEYLLQSAD